MSGDKPERGGCFIPMMFGIVIGLLFSSCDRQADMRDSLQRIERRLGIEEQPK